MTVVVSQMDIEFLAVIRENVASFTKQCADRYATSGARLLDIAPQDHAGARPVFPQDVQVETLDIDPKAGCTYTGDICAYNEAIPSAHFQYVVCTEVLEHVLQPFDAVKEIERVLVPGGYLFLSTPMNFRIHGPLPDCWRFTEHGLRALLRTWTILELRAVETPGRTLMPIHYTVVAQRKA